MPTYYVPKEYFKSVPKEHLQELINSTDRPDIKAILAIAWLSGARIAELCDLTKGSFNINQEKETLQLTYQAKKRGKLAQQEFYFKNPFVSEIVLPYLYKFNTEEKIFPISIRRYQRILLKMNKDTYGDNELKYITFHYLRHGRISQLARDQGAMPEEIKQWTGHKSNAYDDYLGMRRIERFKEGIK